jgi:gamma-glutamyl:cysteine ligase YbdK (ATP-grasp superfamily)
VRSEKSDLIKSVFENKADEIMDNEDRFSKDRERIRAGVETEYFLLNDDITIIEDENKRDNTIKEFDRAKKELGIDSVEIATEPVNLGSFEDLRSSIKSEENKIEARADENNLEVIRSGTNVFRPLDKLKLSSKKFFRQINDYYNVERNELIGEKSKADIGDSKSVSLISAIHTNLEASDFDDAVEKANYVYMISPYISALSGNARFLERKDTGLSDLRMILWSKSHNTEDKQIGRLETYYLDMEDYLDRVGSWPFILGREEKLISDSVSRFWKDSRIKFIGDDLVVESRIASTQPSIIEDVAVHAFCIGRLLYAQHHSEELLDIEKVNENRENALRDGFDSMLYSPEGVKKEASHLLLDEIEKARKGLELNNIKDGEYLDLLVDRVESEKAPSDRLAEKFEDLDSKINSKALFNALQNNNQGV